jgi:hypothetical protein
MVIFSGILSESGFSGLQDFQDGKMAPKLSKLFLASGLRIFKLPAFGRPCLQYENAAIGWRLRTAGGSMNSRNFRDDKMIKVHFQIITPALLFQLLLLKKILEFAQ